MTGLLLKPYMPAVVAPIVDFQRCAPGDLYRGAGAFGATRLREAGRRAAVALASDKHPGYTDCGDRAAPGVSLAVAIALKIVVGAVVCVGIRTR